MYSNTKEMKQNIKNPVKRPSLDMVRAYNSEMNRYFQVCIIWITSKPIPEIAVPY